MESESYGELLGQLPDAFARWIDKLSINYSSESRFDRWFSTSVDDARLQVLARLGAERRDYLAALIDATLGQVKEQGKKFTGETGLELNSVDEMSKSGSQGALEDMREQLHKCDQLFAAIDHATRQTDSPARDEVDSYENRFGYLSSEICDELDIVSRTLNTYATDAGIETPGQGKRNFLHSSADYEKILRQIVKKSSDIAIRKAARDRLARFENKSKDPEKPGSANRKAYIRRSKGGNRK